MVTPYPYQTSPAYYYPAPQAMPMIQQPVYISEPATHGSAPTSVPAPMMVQPVVMAPTAFGTQVAYNLAPTSTPTRANPVFIYNPQVVMSTPTAQQQPEFTVEETSAWLHELCMMRRWNEEADVYKNIFLRHQICGNKMKALNFEDLTVLGIKEEHREELLQAISQAFEEQTSFYQQASYMPAQMSPMCMTPPRQGESETTPFHHKETECMSETGATTDGDCEMQISEDESRWSMNGSSINGWQAPQPVQTESATHSSRSPSPSSRSSTGFGRTRVEESPMSYARVVGASRKLHMDVSQTSDESTTEVVAPKKKKKLMPRPKNPMPYHVLMTLKMKTGRSLQSTYIGHVTKDTVVWVNTVRGRRARIVEKTETGTKNLGWVSLRLEDGKPLLVQEQEYLANPSLYPIRDSETGSPIDGA